MRQRARATRRFVIVAGYSASPPTRPGTCQCRGGQIHRGETDLSRAMPCCSWLLAKGLIFGCPRLAPGHRRSQRSPLSPPPFSATPFVSRRDTVSGPKDAYRRIGSPCVGQVGSSTSVSLVQETYLPCSSSNIPVVAIRAREYSSFVLRLLAETRQFAVAEDRSVVCWLGWHRLQASRRCQGEARETPELGDWCRVCVFLPSAIEGPWRSASGSYNTCAPTRQVTTVLVRGSRLVNACV